MRRARLIAVFAACVAIACGAVAHGQFSGTYATFTDSATGSTTVTADTNFVPSLCRATHSTLADWNIIKGTNAGETLNGTNGDDLIWGLGGDDTISGGNGADCIVGGDGNDTLNGQNQADILIGGNGNDGLNGGNQTDTCEGGDGTDTFSSCEVIIGPNP
jgi:Ca2+-binding RTX toxin-like protein